MLPICFHPAPMSHLSENSQVRHPLRSARGRSITSSSNSTTPHVPITRASSTKKVSPPPIKKAAATVAKKNSPTLRTTPPILNALPVASARPNPVPPRAPVVDIKPPETKPPEPDQNALLLEKVSYAISVIGNLPEESARKMIKQELQNRKNKDAKKYETEMEKVPELVKKDYSGREEEREAKLKIIKEKHKINLKVWAAHEAASGQERLWILLGFMKRTLEKLKNGLEQSNGANVRLCKNLFYALNSMYKLYLKLDSVEFQADMYLYPNDDLECTWTKESLKLATHDKTLIGFLIQKWTRVQADIEDKPLIKEITLQRIIQMVDFCEGKIEKDLRIIKNTDLRPGDIAPTLTKY